MDKFNMKDVGNVTFVLGMRVARDRENDKLTISRKKNPTRCWIGLACQTATQLVLQATVTIVCMKRGFKFAATTPTMASQLRVTS